MSSYHHKEPWPMSIDPRYQQQLQNQQPHNPYADPRSYGPYQPIQPPGYSPLSEADVQRIAIAVVARLEALRGDGG